MKNIKALYKKQFTRDFTLAVVETWCLAETIHPKGWTQKTQPYMPYVVAERYEHSVSFYYDSRGITWLKEELTAEISQKPKLIFEMADHYKEACRFLRESTTKASFSREELGDFLKKLERFWVWFECLWWIWEMEPEEKARITVPEEVYRLRETSQEVAPDSDKLIRRILASLYPQYSDYYEVLTVSEISTGNIPDLTTLEERKSNYFFAGNQLYTGKDKKFIEDTFSILFEKEEIADSNEFKGTAAFKGKVSGKVKIVFGPKQMEKVEEGDILVAPMTLPDILPAMKKASAFVTDEGGVMCHAAIIAREMKKPCIIGTKIATQVLKDGDMVEVDAERGVVKIIQKI